MKLYDKGISDLQLSRKEFNIVTDIIAQFSQEIHWSYDYSRDKDLFTKEFAKKYGFLLLELDYIMCELWGIRKSIENEANVTEVYIVFFNEVVSNKPRVIYTALNECNKNYEKYEISIITGISKKELDEVLKEFKEKVINAVES